MTAWGLAIALLSALSEYSKNHAGPSAMGELKRANYEGVALGQDAEGTVLI